MESPKEYSSTSEILRSLANTKPSPSLHFDKSFITPTLESPLWVKGVPGAGKSTIIRFIVQGMADRGDHGVSFSFFNSGETDLRREEPSSSTGNRAISELSAVEKWEAVLRPFFPDFALPPSYGWKNDFKPIFDETKPINFGGTGRVYRAKFDSSLEHKFIPRDLLRKLRSSDTQDSDVFAVKKLDSANFRDFSREDSNLRRLTQKSHPHIVPFLGSYHDEGRFHLLFPWANGDLAMYWSLFPEPYIDKYTLDWVAKQTRGLAGALSVVHGYEDGEENPKWYGRHGDIKPANILWFSENNTLPIKRGPKCCDEASNPRLTLADFGSSLIVPLDGQHIRQAENVKHTPVYRAPECDINSGRLTPAYDVWSLGCVFAEMLVWLIDGNAGLQELSLARFDEEVNSPNRNAFFQLQRDMSGRLTAQIKPEVQRLLLYLRNHPRSTPFSDDMLNLVMEGMLKIDMDQRMTSRDVYIALNKICEKLADSPDYTSLQCGSVKVHSNQYASKRKRLDGTVDANYYTNATTQSLSESIPSIELKSHLKFACPFFKCGILVSEYSRACKGPGFKTVARLVEHLFRCHTIEKYRPDRVDRVCARCDEEFETENLCLIHQRQDFRCNLQTPEVSYGMLNREQAVNLRSTKRKSSSYTDKDRWFDIFRIVRPSYDLSNDNVSPYHEDNTTSLDTINTESSNGLSQYMDHLNKPLAGSELQEFTADLGNILGSLDPEVSKALLAKIDEHQVKRLKRFNDDRLKPVCGYGIQGNGSDENVEPVEKSGDQVPIVTSPTSQLFVWDNQEEFGNL